MTAEGDPPRLAPIPAGEWPPEMRAALAALLPERATHPLPARTEGRPKGLNALGLLARHPALTHAYHTFNGHILFATTLTPRQRELAVLRVGWLRAAEYEWLQHAVLAGDAGITDEEVVRVAAGPDAPGWPEPDAALLRAVDELVSDAEIGDETWAALTRSLDDRQLMDLIFTVGAYDLLAMAFKSCRVPLDEDLRKWRSRFGIAVISSGHAHGREASDGPLREAR